VGAISRSPPTLRYHALACDYDGTLAAGGAVAPHTVQALERLRAGGRKVVLVTGRILADLLTVLPRPDLFDAVVAENGAILYDPRTAEERVLAEPPPADFVRRLEELGVSPLATGRVIVASLVGEESKILRVIREQGLELQLIFNKGAVMILPAGVNKASGLKAALLCLHLSPRNAVGVGDGENDHALLGFCECSAAVAGAVATLKRRADLVLSGDDGEGTVELIEALLEDDLRGAEGWLERRQVLVGYREDGRQLRVSPYGVNLLLTGPSGGGKSTLASGLLERFSQAGYQYCLVDPEGDHQTREDAVVLGSGREGPEVDEVVQVLTDPRNSVVVNMLGLRLRDRPALFARLLARLRGLRARTGRPHWIVLDEAHHLLPSPWDPAAMVFPRDIESMILITIHPDQVAPAILSAVDMLIAVGESPSPVVEAFARVLGKRAPPIALPALAQGEALVWANRAPEPPFVISIPPAKTVLHRHRRKYAEGELGADRSFYFRGPEGKLNLRAQNLNLFVQLAWGVDDRTWSHHLERGDYSRWFREAIKDQPLAEEAEEIENRVGLSAEESRALIAAAVERHYTLPARRPI
jgi:HAD superfamily hydrolase (TIGR01484 family)